MSGSVARYSLVTPELTAKLQNDKEERKSWVFLEESKDFKGYWRVEGFSQAFFFDLKDIIGTYKVVSPFQIDAFLDTAIECGYNVAFLEPPHDLLGSFHDLDKEPPVKVSSELDNTVNGLLPFQVQGFNFLSKLDGSVALWSTGTGKTVLASAVIAAAPPDTSLVLFVVKAHNKVNTARRLDTLVGLDSIVVDGTKDRRRKLYDQAHNVMADPEVTDPPILILNYEKFRTDKTILQELIEDENVLIIWDEMPARLKTRTSQVYKGVTSCLYNTSPPAVDWKKKRPKSLKQVMLSGTPIENSPEDFFNCVRILDPRVFGTVAEFEDIYVAAYDHHNHFRPSRWQNLDRMNLIASSITHRVDKDDPDIAEQFPDVIEETYTVDWDPKHRRIYDLLVKKADQLGLEETNALAMITVLQMLSDAPSMVANSAVVRSLYDQQLDDFLEAGGDEPKVRGSEAAQRLVEAIGSKNLEDAQHGKLATLRELICETHPDEKIVVFSAYNEGLLPIIEQKLDEWGVSFVRYNGTDKQKQKAQDSFMEDPTIQVFLSSDQGADSLSLEEASVVIHYDLPWKWSTYIQRQNRIHRVVSKFNKVRYYTLMMDNSVEDRKLEIIEKKKGFHEQIFGGTITQQTAISKLTQEDLEYILKG